MGADIQLIRIPERETIETTEEKKWAKNIWEIVSELKDMSTWIAQNNK